MDMSMVTTVAAIVIICYLVGVIVKATKIDNKYIPAIVGSVGGALGVIGMYVISDFPAKDVLNAIAVGIVSGLASTGADQIIKQLIKK